MKRTITISLGMLFVLGSMAQTITVLPEYGSGWGGGVEIDLNNDGYLDLTFGGNAKDPIYLEDPDGNQVETYKSTKLLMWNNETKAYESKPISIVNADRAVFVAEDFNRDGNMDLLVCDHARDVFYSPGIYLGGGDGTFTKAEMTFDDATYQFRPVTADAADFNNDGLMDIVAIGYEKIDEVVTSYSAVLINKGNNQFAVTNRELLQDYQLALAEVKALDHNNDGFMDFFVSANCDNPASNNGARVLADIFENLGTEEPGTFYRLFLGDGTIYQKANGGLNIADFNQDGWLDFVIHGEGGEGTGEPTSGEIWACISHVYINQKNGTYAEKAQPDFSADLRPLNSSGFSTGAIDWDGNGTTDIFIPGWNPAPETGTQAGFYWLNDGNAAFGSKTRVPGASEIFMMFPDWDGDGVRDYFMAGQSWDGEYFTEEQKGRIAAVMINDRTAINQRPSAPSGLAAAVDGSKVTLSWESATDAETAAKALSYEFYIKKDGALLTSCNAFVGGDKDGVRKALKLGNAQLNHAITVNSLADGDYEWGVQAIDASYDGSTFATGTFKIGGNAVNDHASLENLVHAYAVNGVLNVHCDQVANINVYTVTGSQVASANNTTSYNVNLVNGVYILKVNMNNQLVTRKVIVK